MNIDLLRVSNLRCFEQAELAPVRGINWLVGANGAGKTTILEAAYILSHGRTFRSGGRSTPRRHGARAYTIHAAVSCREASHRLGLSREDDHWQARLDGTDLATLGPLFAVCPVVCFGPESASLMLGAADERRGFLDWTVFHVEHDSLATWRRWRRALRQRNALLRDNAPDALFEPWERELGVVAQQIHQIRGTCIASLDPYITEEAHRLIPELGEAGLRYRAGWNEEEGLASQLAQSRASDRERGFTQAGAHRADWTLVFANIARREHLSRGQAKAAAMVCAMAQTRWLADRLGEYPLLCLDDPASELDRVHVDRVLAWLSDKAMQTWITTTEPPRADVLVANQAVFHVEHSGIARR